MVKIIKIKWYNNKIRYLFFIFFRFDYSFLTMASKSSTEISCHQHRILLLARDIPFFLTHSNPYICCMILCDRNGIMTTSSVSRRLHNQKVQWNYSVGERRLMFQKVNSRTSCITMTGYQTMQFTNNYCEEKFISARETDKHLQSTTILPPVLVSTNTIGNW